MCTNYRAPKYKDIVDAIGPLAAMPMQDWPEEIYMDYAAPLVRAGDDGKPQLLVGTYGMIPKRKMPAGARWSTMNARAETIGEKRTYSKPWRQAQTCLLPTTWFYEPNYETGKAQRFAIATTDDQMFCVAGLWKAWEEEEGGFTFSFTQITINADEHPVMRRFHKPGDEKRSVVILPRSEWDGWLNAGDPEIARAYLQNYPSELMKAWPAEKGYGGKTQVS